MPFKIGWTEKILLLLGASALGFFGGWKANGWREGEKAALVAAGEAQARQVASEAARQREALATSLGAAFGLQLRSALERSAGAGTIREKEIRNEIVRVPEYSSCVLTPGVYAALRDAIADANSNLGGASTPPVAGPPAKR